MGTVWGVGVNDYPKGWSKGTLYRNVYLKWKDMLRRCYDPKAIAKRPNYEFVTVDPRWHSFTNFFCDIQEMFGFTEDDFQALHLDKDILVLGNHVYSKDHCVLVPQELNNFFHSMDGKKGFKICNGKYQARIQDGVPVHIGTFETEQEAIHAYNVYKTKRAKDLAVKYNGFVDSRVIARLLEDLHEH